MIQCVELHCKIIQCVLNCTVTWHSVSITETECVYCVARCGSLHISIQTTGFRMFNLCPIIRIKFMQSVFVKATFNWDLCAVEGPVSADSPRHGNWYKQDSRLEVPALGLGRQIIRLRATVWQILRCEKGRFSPCLQGDNVQHIPLKCSEMETGEMNLYAASGSMCMKMQLLETSNLYRCNRKLWNATCWEKVRLYVTGKPRTCT